MNLHPELKRLMQEQEKQGGIELDKLPQGTIVEVQTKNTLYKIIALGNNLFRVSGGKYYSTPKDTKIPGSTFGGSMIKVNWLGIGMHVEFPACTTTAVRTLKVVAPDGSWEYTLDASIV